MKALLSHFFSTPLTAAGRVELSQALTCMAMLPELENRRNAQTASLEATVIGAVTGKRAHLKDTLISYDAKKSKPVELYPEEWARDMRQSVRIGWMSNWLLARLNPHRFEYQRED